MHDKATAENPADYEGMVLRHVLHEQPTIFRLCDLIERLRQRHTDHGADRVAGSARPAGSFKFLDQPPYLGRIEETFERGGGSRAPAKFDDAKRATPRLVCPSDAPTSRGASS